MKIAISGSSGFLGVALSGMFKEQGCEVVAVARKNLYGDYIHVLSEELSGVDVVINLAGATINRSWSDSYKDEIFESRIASTQKIVDVINHMEVKPKLFISASAIGYYSSKECNDEQGAKGDGFLSYVCANWESVALRVDSSVRCVIMRMGVVVSKRGGAYAQLFKMADLYHVTMRFSSGCEVVSWIELSDLLRLYEFVINTNNISGVVNCVAPMPFTGSTFTKLLNKRFTALTFVVPKKVVEIAMGERSEILFNSVVVYPKVAIDSGFVFGYDNIGKYIGGL